MSDGPSAPGAILTPAERPVHRPYGRRLPSLGRRNRFPGALGIAAALASPLPCAAQAPEMTPPVVVTATRIPTSAQRIGSAVTVIDREAIEASGKTQVQELLRRVPGLTVINRGGPGGRTDVSIRGADEDQTLVLIDGVPVNDPASTGGRFDFSGLSTSGLERIEILRGPQSALYGSAAMGGVINIITRKGAGAPSGYAALELGSHETNIQRAGFSVGEESWDVALDASREASEGFSRVEGGAEDDGARSTTFTGRGGYAPHANLRFEGVGRVEDIDADLDPSNTVDGFADKDETIYNARVGAELDLLDGRWRQRLDLYGSTTERRFRDPAMTSDFDGQRVGIEYLNDFFVTDNQTITAGIDVREDSGRAQETSGGTSRTRFDESEYTRSLFGLYQVSADDRVFLTGGVRADDFEEFGTEVTYRFTAAVLTPSSGTTFRGSVGTGAKAPTIQQRFDDTFLFGFLPVMGNPDLGVEKSTGWDLGVEQSFWNERASVDVTLFENRFDDLIEFDAGSGTFVQVDSAKTRGVEVGIDVRPIDMLRITGTYTYLDSEDESDGSELARRPKNSGSLVADVRMSSRASMQASVILVGERFNLSGEREPLAGYARFDLAARYAVSSSVELLARIENLFDADYEEVADLATPGRSFFAGVRAEF